MASSPSPTYQRLRHYIAKQMRMSHIYQPLMLMELLGRSSPAPAQDVARRILGEDVTQIDYYTERVKRMVGKVLTSNGITAYGNGAYSLIGGDELSDGERDALLELCRQRLDAFREQRALEVDHIIPKNQDGSDAITNLQALCIRCNAGKRDGCLPTQEGAPTSAVCRPATATAKQAVCSARWRAAAGSCW